MNKHTISIGRHLMLDVEAVSTRHGKMENSSVKTDCDTATLRHLRGQSHGQAELKSDLRFEPLATWCIPAELTPIGWNGGVA